LIFIASIYFISSNYTKRQLCKLSQGKWATNGHYCISKNCAKNKSCKPSYDNNEGCKRLHIGASKDEVFFQLGMPIKNSNDTYEFLGGADKKTIIATIENEKLSKLTCP